MVVSLESIHAVSAMIPPVSCIVHSRNIDVGWLNSNGTRRGVCIFHSSHLSAPVNFAKYLLFGAKRLSLLNQANFDFIDASASSIRSERSGL